MKILVKLTLYFLSMALLVLMSGFVSLRSINKIKQQTTIKDLGNDLITEIINEKSKFKTIFLTSSQEDLSRLLNELIESKQNIDMFINILMYGDKACKINCKTLCKSKGYTQKYLNFQINPKISKTVKELHIYYQQLDQEIKRMIINTQKSKLDLLTKFDKLYSSEKNQRYELMQLCIKKDDKNLLNNIWNIYYLSKEVLFQYKDTKHLDKWLKSINLLKENAKLLKFDELYDKTLEYYQTAQKIDSIQIRIKNLDILLSLNVKVLNNSINELIDLVKKFQSELDKTSNKTKSQITFILIIITLFTLILAITIGFFISKSISTPILELKEATSQIGKRNLNTKINIKASDEIADLAQSFILMIEDLKKTTASRDELNEAKIKAEDASRAKSQFLANMSHEIRTPMNGVLGFLEILSNTTLSTEQKEYLKNAKISADSLLVLINDILDFSKIEAGKLDLDYITFNLHSTIENAVTTFVPSAYEKWVDISVLIKPGIPEKVIGDPSRLRQIFINLIGNAVKFTEKGEIKVIVELSDKNVKSQNDKIFINVKISDTGIGISKENIEKLFKIFSQVDSSSTRKFKGTGLGLAISKKLVELQGGEISVESELNVGTTFSFTIPFTIAPYNQKDNKFYFQDIKGSNVLVVEDNEFNRIIFKTYLEELECNIFEANDAKHALNILNKNNNFNFMIIDYCMPEMDGVELAKIIKSNPTLSSIPLICITSIANRNDAKLIKEANFSGYLSKPLCKEELKDCIALVLGLKTNTKNDNEKTFITKNSIENIKNKTNKKILLAEDNKINQKLVIKMLQFEGYSVNVVSNGIDVIEAFKDTKYDLILMDCQMPEMNGFDATKQIRKWEKENSKEKTPIFALTAYAMENEIKKCFDAGMDDYISKPIDRIKLIEKIKIWLEK